MIFESWLLKVLSKSELVSYKGRMVDALADRGDEGRVRLLKGSTSCQKALTRTSPNVATQ